MGECESLGLEFAILLKLDSKEYLRNTQVIVGGGHRDPTFAALMQLLVNLTGNVEADELISRWRLAYPVLPASDPSLMRFTSASFMAMNDLLVVLRATLGCHKSFSNVSNQLAYMRLFGLFFVSGCLVAFEAS